MAKYQRQCPAKMPLLPSQARSWAAVAREVIVRVKMETGLSGEELRKELRKHYPFGERSNWPYKAWLIEVDQACGISERKQKHRPLQIFDKKPLDLT